MSFPIELKRPLVIFDLETTGLSTRKDRIVELAAIKVFPDGHEEVLELLLNPTITIPKDAEAIHGISNEMVKDCPTFEDKAGEILMFFAGCDISGFNSDRYDIPLLEEELLRTGRSLSTAIGSRIDVQRIFHKMHPRTLTAAVRIYCKRDHVGAHGALADSRATLDVLSAMLTTDDAAHAVLKGKTIDELEQFIAPVDPLNADRAGMFRWNKGKLYVNFGKKKGKALKDLMINEPKFLQWIVNGEFDADTRAIAANALEGRLPEPPQETVK